MISKLTTHNVLLLSSVPVVPHGDTKRRVLPEVDFVVVRVLDQVVRLTGVRGDRDHGQGRRFDTDQFWQHLQHQSVQTVLPALNIRGTHQRTGTRPECSPRRMIRGVASGQPKAILRPEFCLTGGGSTLVLASGEELGKRMI